MIKRNRKDLVLVMGFVFILVFLPIFVSAELPIVSIGHDPLATTHPTVFKTGSAADVKVQCISGGALCTPGYTCAITIIYPNSDLFVDSASMTPQSAFANYTLTDTSISGHYACSATCCQSITCGTTSCDFDITPTGTQLSISGAIINIIIFIVSLLILAGLLVAGIALPSKNNTEEMTGYVIAVNNMKYLKMLFLAFAYLTALFITYFSWMLSYAYLEMNFMATIFQDIFYGMAVVIVPLFIIGAYILIANLVRDAKLKDLLSRGLSTKGV